MGAGKLFSSPRERRLWIWAGVVTLAVYASLYFVRAPIEWLRERNLLRLTVAVIFLVVVVPLLRWIVRRRPRRRELVVLAVCGAVYLVVLLATERHEEKLHYLEYGAVGGLTYGALLERRRNLGGPPPAPDAEADRLSDADRGRSAWAPDRWPGAWAVALTGLAGWADEGIQALLPNRVGEFRDAAMNLAAGVLIVLSMAALGWARRRDQLASGPASSL